MSARNKKPSSITDGAGSSQPNAATSADPKTVSQQVRPAATRQAEIETKLEIEPDVKLPSLGKRRRLAAVGITGAADPQTYYLDATYYDTENLDLLRSKMTLRRRTGGTDAGWHLKLPAVQGARTEVGLPLDAGEPGDVPAEFARPGARCGAGAGRWCRSPGWRTTARSAICSTSAATP